MFFQSNNVNKNWFFETLNWFFSLKIDFAKSNFGNFTQNTKSSPQDIHFGDIIKKKNYHQVKIPTTHLTLLLIENQNWFCCWKKNRKVKKQEEIVRSHFFLLPWTMAINWLAVNCQNNSLSVLKIHQVSTHALGVIHKLRWQDFCFFWPPTPLRWHFYGMNVDKKWTFMDHLPTSSCSKCSLWTAPYLAHGIQQLIPDIFYKMLVFRTTKMLLDSIVRV